MKNGSAVYFNVDLIKNTLFLNNSEAVHMRK